MKLNRELLNINLKAGHDGPLVILPEEEGLPSPEPFAFPPMPWSTLIWLGTLGGSIWDQHKVCCSLLLLLNPQRRCWGITVPPQKPRREGVSWQMTDTVPMGNTPDTPHHIGGTFQMAQADNPEQVLDLVPKVDGLHLVHRAGAEQAGAWMFLRVEGELALQNPNDIIVDDWGSRIAEVMRVLDLHS